MPGWPPQIYGEVQQNSLATNDENYIHDSNLTPNPHITDGGHLGVSSSNTSV